LDFSKAVFKLIYKDKATIPPPPAIRNIKKRKNNVVD
jgi:hypothetical protein